MTHEMHQKVMPSHLQRDAYLYVRQSTLHQVLENTESTTRQYALRERAVALGWAPDRVVVIDSDLGQSGTATDREGFARLVADVGMGRVGVVLGLEVSRLARTSVDWHRLLEICALTDTLILDEDGLYNPGHFNDRLLLGLKGTMSEAELHVLRARLQGGILSKASRGELKIPLPVGLVYGPDGAVALDPDRQVQTALELFFVTFRQTGSACATVRRFREEGLLFPRRVQSGAHQGEIVWAPLYHWRALRILKNPRYTGAFVYGRSRERRVASGRGEREVLPRDQWHTFLPGAHPGYITWAEYEDNLRRLGENAQAHGADRRRSPPREGPALVQGVVLCGRCGGRMTVRYHCRGDRLLPDYMCQKDGIEQGERICQQVPGWSLDEAIGDLLVETVTPLALEVALTVQQELAANVEEADRLRRQQVERARYEAELAQRRYLRVDPDNRLVADSLEADWNRKLQGVAAAQEEYDRRCQIDQCRLDEEQRAQILAVARDFPRLWREPATPDRDRKRMVRLLVEDVTLRKDAQITAHVRFRGGATRTLILPIPQPSWQIWQTAPAVVQEIDRLLDEHTDGEVAALLNERGVHPGQAARFTTRIVARLRRTYHLADHATRLRRAGLLTLAEVAAQLGVCIATVRRWQQADLLVAYPINDKGEYLYAVPPTDAPLKWKHKGLASRPEAVSHKLQEVQCGA